MLQFPGLQLVHLVWDGPISFDEARKLLADEDYGLYALYGTHTIFGADALLYVGRANAQRFGQRLPAHYPDWIRHSASDITVYVGRIGGWEFLDDAKWGKMINQTEHLVVHYTSPPYNSGLIKNPPPFEPMLILNHNRRHRLPQSITNIPDLINTEDGVFHLCGHAGHGPTSPPDPVQ